ncbi:MAG: hypothetical protein AAF108_10365 [Planctomycetota bacterium]
MSGLVFETTRGHGSDSSTPTIAFASPVDAADLPRSKAPFLLMAAALTGTVLSVVIGIVLNAPVVAIGGGAAGLLAGIVLLVVGLKRIVDRGLATFTADLDRAGIRHAPNLDRETAKALFPQVAHLEKWLKYGSRGLKSYGETTVATDRGDLAVRLFYHRYTVSTGNSHHVVQHWIALAPPQESGHPWPELTLSNENFVARIAKKLGREDHELDDTSFNDRWLVRCDDPDFPLVALPPVVQSVLADSPRYETWVFGPRGVAVLHVGVHKSQAVVGLAHRVARVRAMMPTVLDAGWTPNVATPK